MAANVDQCLLCHSLNVSKKIRVGASVWAREGLSEKIRSLTTSEILREILERTDFICHGCLIKVNSAYGTAIELQKYSGAHARSPVKSVAKKLKPSSPEKSRIPLRALDPSQQHSSQHEKSKHVRRVLLPPPTPSSPEKSRLPIRASQKLASQPPVQVHDFSWIQDRYIQQVQEECTALTFLDNPSCLRAPGSLDRLRRKDFLLDCFEELKRRCPCLHDVLLTAATPRQKDATDVLVGPFAMVFGVLMFLRNQHLSAFQRAFSLIMTKGCLTTECHLMCNKLGLTLGQTARINLLDECGKKTCQKATEVVESCSLCNLVGDNLDIVIRPRSASSSHPVQFCHYFGLILIFSRLSSELIANSSTIPPQIKEEDLSPARFLLNDEERSMLLNSYGILLGRLMTKHFPAFDWLRKCLPQHIPHSLEHIAEQKSTFIPLKLILKDEKYYEDCVNILRESNDMLHEIFRGAEQEAALAENPPVFFGDQLTRARLHGARTLLTLAPTQLEQIGCIGPVVCTLWHMKQDFLEKAYKSLWKEGSGTQDGTLMYFKNILRMAYVNGRVKTNYRAHEELLLAVGEQYLMEQVMESFDMENHLAWPKHVPENVKTLPPSAQQELASQVLVAHLKKHNYLAFPKQTSRKEDQVFNHASNLCQWTLHLMNVNDMAKEGDADRAVLSLKAYLPFFYQHSDLSKYFVECLDVLLKTTVTSPSRTRLQILEGSFVNRRGGKGNNVETDLLMEHHVRNTKDLIRSLKSNKTEHSIQRATLAAEIVNDAFKTFQDTLSLSSVASRQSRKLKEDDVLKIKACLRQLKPFRCQEGREYGCMNIPASPQNDKVLAKMLVGIARTVARLTREKLINHHDAEAEAMDKDSESDDSDS